jgi:hypothetical protein
VKYLIWNIHFCVRMCRNSSRIFVSYSCAQAHMIYLCSLVNIQKLMVNLFYKHTRNDSVSSTRAEPCAEWLSHACVSALMWRELLQSHCVRHRYLHHVFCFTTSWYTQKKFWCKHWHFIYSEVSRIIDYLKIDYNVSRQKKLYSQ